MFALQYRILRPELITIKGSGENLEKKSNIPDKSSPGSRLGFEVYILFDPVFNSDNFDFLNLIKNQLLSKDGKFL